MSIYTDIYKLKPEETKVEEVKPEKVPQSFSLTFSEAKEIRGYFEALRQLVEEAEFTVNDKGLSSTMMDASHVAMYMFNYPKEGMYDFSYAGGEVRFNLNLEQALKFFKTVKNEDSLKVEWGNGTYKMRFSFLGRNSKTYTMPTLEASNENMPMPKVTFNARVKMNASSLKDAFKDLENVGYLDHVRLEADGETTILKAESSEGNKCEFKYERGDERILSIEVKELSKGAYNINYLKGIVEAVNKVSNIAILEWSTNMPIKITPECDHEVSLCYYLAPRIETEDYEELKAKEVKAEEPKVVNTEAEIAVPQPETS